MKTIYRNRFVAGSLAFLAATLTAGISGAQTCGVCNVGTFPQTVTVSGSFPAGAGFASNIANNQPITLPQYNPANHNNAPLVGVNVRLRGRTRSSGTVNNNNTIDFCSGEWRSNVSASITSDATLGLPNTGSGNAVELQVQRVETFINLAPQGQINYPEEERTDTGTVCVFSPAILPNWTGAGNVTIFVNGFDAGQTPCSTPQCLNVGCQVFNSFRLEVEVTYTFCATDGGGDGVCPCTGPSPHYRRPGSLLLYPEFDNRDGNVTLITVTNTKCDFTDGDVRIEIRYINETNCAEDNFTRTLTACDTFSFLTKALNPNPRQGYIYIYAKDAQNRPIVWNHLIGSLLVISGIETFDYSINPVAFRGIGSPGGNEQPDRALADLDGDGILDLDGREYEPAPDVITIPRFLGQDTTTMGDGPGGLYQSQLILIALSGGQQFTTTVDFCIYNDNEELFSSEWTFYCWDKPYLTDITFLFGNQFLKNSTNHNPLEIFGANSRESGWMAIQGAVASSSQEDIDDPAFYAVLVERVGSYAVSDLPWECGFQFNGALLPRDLLGDGDPVPQNGDNQ